MMFESEYRKRVNKTYDNMARRARPRLWKTGKKRGLVRTPGLDQLPFWKDDLWNHVIRQVPEGGALCPYCKDYARSTTIHLDTFTLDHHVPIKNALAMGLTLVEAWSLRNLICVCADCNNLKGSMSYTAFIVLMRDFLPHFDRLDQKYVTACLRTHGQVVRGWGETAKPAKAVLASASKQPRLDDSF